MADLGSEICGGKLAYIYVYIQQAEQRADEYRNLQRRLDSSVVERKAANQEVPGSNLG